MKTFEQLNIHEQAMALRQERSNILTALALGQVRVADVAAQKEVISAVSLALVNNTPHFVQESAKLFPDYKSLFEQAIFHLRCVSGSRNSFSMEMRERMFDPSLPTLELRSKGVEKLHQEAFLFLNQYDV